MSQIPHSLGASRAVACVYIPLEDHFVPVAYVDVLRAPPVYETSQFAMREVDWKETRNAHIIRVDVPGLNKEQVKVEAALEGGGVLLVISGERKEEEEEGSYVCHRMERSFGNFHRRFNLPDEEANVDLIKATLADGVLTIVVPKKIKSE